MRPLIQRRVCRAQIARGVLVKLRTVLPDGADGVVRVALNSNLSCLSVRDRAYVGFARVARHRYHQTVASSRELKHLYQFSR